MKTQTTVNFEEPMRLFASHAEALVDERGRTYFNVFRTEPAEAVFDWPDYVDLPARYLEAAAMIEPVVGGLVETVPALRKWLYGFVEADGLAYRPNDMIANHEAELFDQARYIHMLATWAMYDPEDREVRERLANACRGLMGRATFEGDYAYINRIEVYFGGTLIRPMMQAALVMNRPDWIDFAGKLTKGILHHSEHFAADGSFKGHHHGHLGCQAGMLAWALVTGDDRVRDRVRQIFDWSRSISTSFGFVPEVAQRPDDLVACETCTLMDYLDAVLLLARHVDPGYWDVAEKAARNHLMEVQVRDASWLAQTPEKPDEEDIIRSRIRQRVLGSFAGWSAPHAMLACAEEQQRFTWVKSQELQPRYWGKVRAIQNCCAGAGVRGLHQVWSNIATFADGQLSVNMLMGKRVPEARITGFAPFEGRATIQMLQDCRLRFRPSSDLRPEQVNVRLNGRNVQTKWNGPFVEMGAVRRGDQIEVAYPLPQRREAVTIGNPGFQSYRFQADWKGDTVIAVEPDPNNATTGHSHVMNQRIPVYYGPDAPGRLYQRDAWRKDRTDVALSQPAPDDRRIDWFSLRSKQ
ncbi:MAG: hypothetical protein GXY33_04130 [Phycisphaerae bacterium]|nr:hypothetical protein [Phycisphaerae bacterium]